MPQASINLADLRGILQYVPRFRDRVFIVAIDGQIAASDNLNNILLDIAVLRSLNIRIILVHGIGYQLQAEAKRRGVVLSSHDGIGVTDATTLDLAVNVATSLTHEIMEGLTTVDLRAAYTNCLIAHPTGIIGGIDQQFTGKIEKVDAKCLEVMLDEGIVPIVPPIGFDGEGRTYRVNSDAIAVEIGEAVRAAKILFMLAQDGLVINGSMIRQLPAAEAEELVRKKRL
ncbi:MAG: amino-acid N-acetyltransferase, partial [Verrucomicrobiia bacterium]